MKTLTVKQAVSKVNNGESLEGFTMEKKSFQQVNVRDALVLNKGGVVVPEENLFYNDDEIESDDELDGLVFEGEITGASWEEKAALFSDSSKEVEIVVNLSTSQPEIDSWIFQNRAKRQELLKPIVINLFNAEKSLNK